MDENAVVETLVPSAPDSGASPVTEPVPPSPPPEDRRAVIADAFKKTSVDRGTHAQFQPRDQGKFAGPPKFPTPQPPQPTAVERPAMPKSLRKELQAHWETAHPELAAAIHQRELDYEKGVQPLKAKAQQADELLGEFQPYEAMLRAESSTPKQAINHLLKMAYLMRTGSPLQKAQLLGQTMRDFGVPLEHIQAVLSGQVASPPPPDPQYQQLSQQLQQVRETVTTWQQQQHEAVSMAEIDKFRANPEHAGFDDVAQDMLPILEKLSGVDDPTEEKLALAYELALRKHPEVVAKLKAADALKQQAPTEVTRTKRAAVQVTGAPSAAVGQTINPQDRRAVIAAAMRSR